MIERTMLLIEPPSKAQAEHVRRMTLKIEAIRTIAYRHRKFFHSDRKWLEDLSTILYPALPPSPLIETRRLHFVLRTERKPMAVHVLIGTDAIARLAEIVETEQQHLGPGAGFHCPKSVTEVAEWIKFFQPPI